MRIMGLVGWSGSGKTRLVTALLPLFRAEGLVVSTMKHAHHAFEPDVPGKDSYRHRQAGAAEVLLASAGRWVLLHETGPAPEPSVAELIARMTPVDLLLIEGFKQHDHPRLEVHRPALGRPLLCPGDPGILAVASDVPVPGLAVPCLDLNAPEAIAWFILRHAAPLARGPASGVS